MDIKEVLDKFSNKRIVVVGDVILDSYIYGEVERVSPEAPVPVVKVEQDQEFFELGGAANTAANIASLGGEVFLFSYVGEDYAKNILLEKLNEKKINHRLLPVLKQTILKTRILASNQQIVRIDKETPTEGSQEAEEKIMQEIMEIRPDIIVTSDYAKGMLSESLFFMLKQYSKANEKKIIVDPRPQNKINYTGVYLITPNIKEAMEMTGMRGLEGMGRRLQEELKANILLTRGKDGMTLFEQDKIINIPTAAKEVYDVTGAGDTVVALMALSIASGLDLEEAAYLANHAAGIVVGKKGTATVSKNELIDVISSEHKKLKTPDELKEIVEDCKRKAKRVVFTNGCFDILHPGHIKYLQEAKEQGDILIVGINSDESVRKLKGSGRPVNNEKHRAEVLVGLECIDYVFVFPEENTVRYLEMFMPNVHVHGGDRVLDESMIKPGIDKKPMNQEERRFAEKNGIKIYFSKIYDSPSTTQTINKIRNETAQAVKS